MVYMTLLTFITLLISSAVSVPADLFSPEDLGNSDALSLLQMDLQVRRREEPAFEVLHVGAPRTGTQTMYTALTRLGLRPLHSGYSAWHRLPWCNYVFGNASFEAAMTTMKGFDAAMDEPFHLIYEEVMHRFPDCKFVLTESDPEVWYTSQMAMSPNTTNSSELALANTDPLSAWVDHQKEIGDKCQASHYWGCDFSSVSAALEAKERCIAGYEAHNERVKSLIPPEKLLVFNLSAGDYTPLAEFLGRPVPDEPLPYTDTQCASCKGNETDTE